MYFSAPVLASGLKRNFRSVTVEVVDCPDLRAAPFHLAAAGLGGQRSALVDIGGPPYLLPNVDRTKIYDLKTIAQRLQPAGADVLCIGAGAGYFPLVQTNCEGIYNMHVSGATGSTEASRTHFALNVVEGAGERCALHRVAADETRCALLMNVFMCEGKPGKVRWNY